MGGCVNEVTLLGYLGGDPEARSFANGGRVVAFSLATAEGWRDRASGERRERTQWHRVAVLAEGLADVAEKHLRKGSRVLVQGQLEHERWTDRDGVERSAARVALRPFAGKLVLLGDRGGAPVAVASPPRDAGEGDGGRGTARADATGRAGHGENGGSWDDDVPF